jgi:hypothetical protein
MASKEVEDLYTSLTTPLSGVCKDCNAGTLNNELNPAFGFTDEENGGVHCLQCGSTHLDLL